MSVAMPNQSKVPCPTIASPRRTKAVQSSCSGRNSAGGGKGGEGVGNGGEGGEGMVSVSTATYTSTRPRLWPASHAAPGGAASASAWRTPTTRVLPSSLSATAQPNCSLCEVPTRSHTTFHSLSGASHERTRTRPASGGVEPLTAPLLLYRSTVRDASR